MKKFNENFKTFSKEEASQIKGGKKAKKEKMDCPPPEPDFES